ncbi:Copper transporter 5 [Spatholobus suberectus]|nr:Copper transporter 5 [Spatholobus suberectus]
MVVETGNFFTRRSLGNPRNSSELRYFLVGGNLRTAPFSSRCVTFRGAKMMHMTFYWGKKVTILFDSWKTDSWASYVLSLVACLVVAAFYQYLENRRIRLKLVAGELRPSPEIRTPLLRWRVAGDKAKLGVKFAGAVLFGVNSAIGYLLMLAIMSFNGGVFVAVVVGLALGYVFFRNEGEDAALVVDNSCACA